MCRGEGLIAMTIITLFKPLPEPIVLRQQSNLDLRSSNGAKIVGILVVVITLALYVLFSPIGLAK